MSHRTAVRLVTLSVLVLAMTPTISATLLVDHFEGDSLKAQWTVSGAGGTYSVGGGFLNVTDIDSAATWADMYFTAQFVAEGDFDVAVGFDYPYIIYKELTLLLLNNHGSEVARLMLEDSPSDYLVFDMDTCYELVSRPAIPSWLTVSRAGGVITAEFEGYAPRTCSVGDTIAALQLVFSRWGGRPYNGISIDSIVAASSNAPSLANVTVDGDTQPSHLTNHAPLVAWDYSDADGEVQHLVDVEVGSDSDWLNGAEMWSAQVTGDSSGITYNGLGLLDGTDYWLRVRANDGLVWGLWTEASFHMNDLPSIPIQVTPADFGEATTNPPTLTAVVGSDAEADLQQLQFGIYVDDTILVQESALLPVVPGTVGDTVNWTAPDTLHENWFYFWSVRSFDGFEITPQFGTMEFFFVNAVDEPPTQSLLYGPSDASIVYSTAPLFEWSTASDPDPNDNLSYQFEIAVNSLFSGALEVSAITDTAYTLFTPLELTTRYWWRVLSQDPDSLETTSLAAQFRIYQPGDVNKSWDVTSADIITLVGYVFKGQSLDVPECAGIVDGDSVVTSADIIYLVNYVFKAGPEPGAGCE